MARPVKGEAIEVAASENHLGEVGGRTAATSASLTRPADTTAYAVKDTVSNSTSATTPMTFAIGRINGSTGYITKARLTTDQSTNTAQFRLHIFRTNAATVGADNAAHTLMWADRTLRIGYIDFGPCSTEGTGSDSAQSLNADCRLAFSCDPADNNLYGVLETLTAFTPASGQQFHIALTAELN